MLEIVSTPTDKNSHHSQAWRLVLAWAVAALIGAGATHAQGQQAPTPYPDFSAKRIRAPEKGSPPKVTVQIAPAGPAATEAAPLNAATVTGAASDGALPYSAFWQALGTETSLASAGRLEDAVVFIQQAENVPTPRLQFLQELITARGTEILRGSIGTEVSPALLLAVWSVEAQGQSRPLTDDKGATGGFPSLSQDLVGQVQRLDALMRAFSGDPLIALAAYRGGRQALDETKAIPTQADVRKFVPEVLAAFQVARGLCLTPPTLASDGCVFIGMN